MRRFWGIVAVLAIVVVALVAVYLFEENAAVQTHVRTILLTSPVDVCGISARSFAVAGYNSSGPGATTVAFQFPNLNASTCTVGSVHTSTAGFVLGGIGVPFSVPAGGHVDLSASLSPPSGSFAGDLVLVFL